MISIKLGQVNQFVPTVQDPLAMTTLDKMSSRIASATKDTQVVQAWVRAWSARLERTKIWSTAMMIARHAAQFQQTLIHCHRATKKVIAFALQDIMLILEHLMIASTSIITQGTHQQLAMNVQPDCIAAPTKI